MAEIIDDIVILGRAVPERLKDSRVTVCLGGLSKSRGFIRLYPTRLKMPVKQWDIIKAEVERNDKDDRNESWKIVGSGSAWEEITHHIEKVGRVDTPYEKRELVMSSLSDCVEDLKGIEQSLGLIYPREIREKHFGKNPQYGEIFQPLLFPEYDESWADVKSDFEFEPRLKYVCPDCKTKQGYHDQKVLEWGWFEYLRKNPDNRDGLWSAAKFDSEQHDHVLFVGNQFDMIKRNSYLIISVLVIQKNPKPPKPKQLSLFD
jgi:hypothetical protein